MLGGSKHILDPPKMRKMQIWMFHKILRFLTSEPPKKMREIPIWMFQKILRFSTFWMPPFDKNADLDVTKDFMIFNFF